MLRMGVIGIGYWGPNLVRNFMESGVTEVGWCCDLSTERLDAIRRRYPSIVPTSDYRELLRDPSVGAVAIATPVSTHFQIARDALLAGKHVLIEKPMTARVHEAEALLALATERGLVLMVDHTFLYTAAVQKLKEVIAARQLGDIYYIDSERVNLGLFQHDVNVLWDLAPHDLSIIDYLLQREPRTVEAVASSHMPGSVSDVAYLTLRYSENLIAHVHVSWLSPVKIRRTVIGGSRQMVIYDDMEVVEKVKVYDRGVFQEKGRDSEYCARFQYRIGDVTSPRLIEVEALGKECRHFAACCAGKETPLSDATSGLRIVQILEAAQRSLARRAEGLSGEVAIGPAGSQRYKYVKV